MLSYHIPGRPATPHTFSHLTDTSVASSRSGVVAGSLGPPGVASRTKANLLQPHCSRGESRFKNSHHRTAAASHTERLESESRVNCSVGIVASTSGKGNLKGPKRQFASDLGVEEQQKGYAESRLTLQQLFSMSFCSNRCESILMPCCVPSHCSAFFAGWKTHQKRVFCQMPL